MEYANVWGFLVWHIWPGFMLGLIWHYLWLQMSAGRFAEKAGG